MTHFACPPLFPRVAERPAPPRAVFLPKEHGSWSLILEPLLLALLVAPSLAGGALALAALAGFFMRRPVRAAFVGETRDQRRAAREVTVLLSALAVAGVFEAGVFAGWTSLWPLLPLAVLAGWFARRDLAGDGRELTAELAGGCVGALLAATIVLLAPLPVPFALTIALLVVARSVPAILTVRSFVRARKGADSHAVLAFASALAATGALVVLAWDWRVPLAALLVALVWLARTCWLLGPRRPDWSARRIGMLEAILGAASVVTLAVTCG